MPLACLEASANHPAISQVVRRVPYERDSWHLAQQKVLENNLKATKLLRMHG